MNWETKRSTFLKNRFCSSKCSSTPPSKCIIEVTTNNVALTSFLLNSSKLLVGLVLTIVQWFQTKRFGWIIYLFKVSSKNGLSKRGFFVRIWISICRVSFNSVYITPVGTMLFNNFLTDVNLEFLNYIVV